MNYSDFFKGKKITQVGLGLLGRGIGDAEFMAKNGADLIVTDLKDSDSLKPSLEMLREYKNIEYHLGGHKLEDFRNRDLILKAAGTPLDSEYIKEAEKNSIPVEMDASLFCKLASGIKVIGVTGTRGKSTTSALIYQMLKAGGHRVFLAGNIRDTATLPLLEKIREGDYVVLELDSWQLQGFGRSGLSPQIAVFTTFFPDHMNYYKGDMGAYFNDKANIFKYQGENDHLVIGEDLEGKYDWKGSGEIHVARRSDVPRAHRGSLHGEHNLLNASCAIQVAEILRVRRQEITSVLDTFRGLAGRLELKKSTGGVNYYNDTNSTTPDATVAGLKAVSSNKNVVLIMGGSDKLLDMSELIAAIPEFCKAVVLLPGTGTDKIKDQMIGLPIQISEAQNLAQAVKNARDFAQRGDVVLFSPAFASFGMFKNEYDRGDKFNRVLAELS